MSPGSPIDVSVDANLPIAAHADQIADLIRTHQVVVVAGETGSGKSTQLPKICLHAGRTRIGHTQPRRIAARSVATRVAEELGTALGDVVGYQVRFEATTSRATQLKVMTDGILLAEIGHDRLLRQYDTIIVDEAHERSLTIDFLLGYLKQLLPKRPDLKVVITSATIDTARFSAHFDDAPIVEVSGRAYPVEVRYAPLTDDDDPIAAMVNAVASLPRHGDILVFCSGEREIKDAAKALTDSRLAVEVLPLFARLTMQEQARVFSPHSGQRVVLATNVAETSLTVPGVRYVVDPGFARISRYSARTKVQRLPIEPISQASANQRAGRCGRVAPGICVRLYSEEDFLGRPRYTEPEILRTNLASVILAMANARLGDITKFPFVEAPDRTHITDGLRLLTELGAITGTGNEPRLTPLGHKLANLPIDPRLGRILLEGAEQGCLKEILVIVAALSIQDVRERPLEQREKADAMHARFTTDTGWDSPGGGGRSEPRHFSPTLRSGHQKTSDKEEYSSASTDDGSAPVIIPHQGWKGGSGGGMGQGGSHPEAGSTPARITPHTGWKAGPHVGKGKSGRGPNTPQPSPGGDFAVLLRLWDYLRAQRKELSSSKFRTMCRTEFLNYTRVREWQDLVTSLREVCKQMHLPLGSHVSSQIRGSAHPRTTLPDGTNARVPVPDFSSSLMDSILTACLSGLLSNIGARILDPDSGNRPRRRGPREYFGARGARFAISPGSTLAKSQPDLVMAVELVETTRLWAHTVAPISVAQVEAVGSHMLTRTYSEPFFSSSTGTVLAHEKVSLLGVPLIADRRVGYGAIDPEQARAIFLQSGLVEGLAIPDRGAPYSKVAAHNATVRAGVEALEDKARRRGLVADDQAIFDFFDSRIPAGICSLAALDGWLRTDPRHPALLRMTTDDVLGQNVALTSEDYPDSWSFGPIPLGLDYHFSPGEDRDGVTVAVPLSALSALDPAPFTWGVPGTRRELAAELIRTLPKPVRTRFVPAPDWAGRALDWLESNGADHSQPFAAELARALQALSGQPVDGWNQDKLPAHLRMGFLVSAGEKTTFSRDLDSLQADLHREVHEKLATSSPRKRASGTTWVFGDIPESVTIRDHGVIVTGYPALKDGGSMVAETLLTSVEAARCAHVRGLARLTGFALPEPYKWVVAHLTNPDKLALGSSPYPSVPALMADARFAAILSLVSAHDPWSVRDQSAFDQTVVSVRPEQVEGTHRLVLLAAETLRAHAAVRQALTGIPTGSDLYHDVTSQVNDLVFNGFLLVIPPRWLPRVPIWLKGAEMRLNSARQDPRRDQARQDQLSPVLDAYAQLVGAHADGPGSGLRRAPSTDAHDRTATDAHGRTATDAHDRTATDARDRTATGPRDSTLPDEITRIGYLIEEFRLQVFAQTLRTAETVSVKRILQAISQIT
ncbi:MAG: ATP-dependent RNA helicase HrpA [Propionibacteriaceae bacterium]|nr:ATP-dependent RNA helicase HrpA [Propionibacteriaceae bacterium]